MSCTIHSRFSVHTLQIDTDLESRSISAASFQEEEQPHRHLVNVHTGRQKGARSVILGCDAQVEFQPSQDPSTGCGLRGGKTKNIQHNTLEIQLEAEFFKLLQ